MSYDAEAWVKKQVDLHRTPSSVLANLATRAKASTLQCWPSQQTIADDLRVNRRTVGLALGYLEEQGFISRERRWRGQGYRAPDLIELQMESKETVVYLWRTYSEYQEKEMPGRYVHRIETGPEAHVHGRQDEEPMRPAVKPMRPAVQANATGGRTKNRKKNRKKEQEVGLQACNARASLPAQETPMYTGLLEIWWDGAEWQIKAGNDAHWRIAAFGEIFTDLTEEGLRHGLQAASLIAALRESWDESSWGTTLANYQDRIAVLVKREA